MNKDLIQQAAQALRIEMVSLRNASITLKEGFYPPFAEADVRVVPQYRAGPFGAYHLIEDEDAESGNLKKIVVFLFETGVRLVDETALGELETGRDAVDEAAVYIEITAQFAVRYCLANSANENELDRALREFEKYNAAFQIWPYWREYVQSTCARIGIPPIPITMYQIPNCDTN
jgi:hypothetical protein